MPTPEDKPWANPQHNIAADLRAARDAVHVYHPQRAYYPDHHPILDNLAYDEMSARAETAEAALADLRALCDEYRANCDPSTMQAQVAEIFRARLEAAVSRGRESTVEIGGQVMTQAQFDAARYPLLHPNPGPTLRGGPYPYEAGRG